jgi:hypothetical protein
MTTRANAPCDGRAGTRFLPILQYCGGRDFQTKLPLCHSTACQYTPACLPPDIDVTGTTDRLILKVIIGYRFDF